MSTLGDVNFTGLQQEHSAHEEHIWWVDMFFFLGFLLSFLMDKLLDTD